LGPPSKTFFLICCRIYDAISVKTFPKLYFIGIGPFRLLRHHALISLPFLLRKKRGELMKNYSSNCQLSDTGNKSEAHVNDIGAVSFIGSLATTPKMLDSSFLEITTE